jgi:hypothetical protein
MITDFIPDPRKALDPMLLTANGMVTDVKPVIPWKAFAPMLVTDDGIVMDVRPLAFRNALSPMLSYVTIRALVAPYNNAVAPDNAPLSLNTLVSHDTVIPDLPYNVYDIVVLGMILGLRPSKNVDSSKMAVVIPEFRKALGPMLVTDNGIVMDVKPVIPWNALSPMLVTDDGIVIDVTPDASKKAFAPILL